MGRGLTDIQILTALDMRDHDGMPTIEVARRLGVTRGQVIGATNRVQKCLREGETHGGVTTPPDNGVGNGTMPRGWWRRA